ncbi:hypothetical protein QR680_015553 [Steinernema hermaphroditum]|uniref:RlpA-like protein double-psi beta-barrel domain-containing protein n=1 Tax=Steinernema hermaphroditum TaxID=289476 RepID=A0AA39HA28_9BILA|nr:hypothetical protein QR680_015553 [Steinernema hermaphroditum]
MFRPLLLVLIASSSASAFTFGQVYNGDFTYYDNAGYGACGTQINAATQDLVAVSPSFWTASNPNNDPLCRNVCVRVSYNGKTITVPVKDKCAGCTAGHIDLSKTAFQKLASLSAGHIYGAQWSFQPC